MTHPFILGRGMLEYPFPCSNGIALLTLPKDLGAADAERLVEFIQALAAGDTPEPDDDA